jgi:hypothetical protein
MQTHVGCSRSESYIMSTLSRKEEQRQQQAKNGYWRNELESLGIDPKQKKELNDEELEKLADNIKRAIFDDYKLAYSEEGDAYKEEAESTVTVG